ncbi:hypothetical protein HMI55_005333 [Coelomomyces lativittatus]|nr:hypothetical protein HMI55_005333 [Coelomomyces lativittatus]
MVQLQSLADNGSGRFSQKLELKQWIDFNNAQRVHLNYLEDLPTVFSMLIFSGTFHPVFTSAVAVLYVVGRQIYSSGYIAKGPEGRVVGAIVHHLAMISMVGSTIYGAAKLLKWI